MSTYEVKVSREGTWWMVAIPALDGLTQARRFADVASQAKDYIAVTTDVPRSQVEVRVSLAPIGGVEHLEDKVAEIAAAAAAAEQAGAKASAGRREIARSLARAHVPVRDIGALLGVTYQRAHQLLH